MKFPFFSLFSAKSDWGTPEPCSVSDGSQQRLLLISVLAPGDQPRLLALPLRCC
jgi:hypothetical protein